MLTFEDIQSRILLAIGGLFLSGMVYVGVTVMQAPSRDDVEKMIHQAQETNLYAQERTSIHRSIEDLYTNTSRLADAQREIVRTIDSARDKINVHAEGMEAKLSLMAIEVERLKFKLDHLEKKNGLTHDP